MSASYSNGIVSVDQNFDRFASKSYAINKINTVDVRENNPHGIGLAIIYGLLAAGCAWAAISAGSVGTFVVAVLFAYLTMWAWRRSKIVDYHLYLMTSSSSTQAYTTRDPAEIMDLRNAIESAMVRQGSGGANAD